MKHMLFLIFTISLSSQVYALSTVDRAAAPSSDVSFNSSDNQSVYHDYDNSDVIQTGQSATKREYNYDAKVKSCRAMDGAWLHFGEIGYSACMDNSQTLKR